MNRKVINFFLILFVVWTALKMLDTTDINTTGEISSRFGYYPVYILYIIELFGLLSLFSTSKFTPIGKVIVCLFVYMTIINLTVSDNSLRDLRDSSWWILVFFLFYKIAVNDYASIAYSKIINYFPFFFILVVILFFIVASIKRTLLFANTFNQLNDIFWVMLLLPFIPLVKNKKLQYVLFFIGLGANLYSMKRSVTVISILLLLFIMYFDFIKNSKHKIAGIFLMAIIGLGSISAFNYLDDISENYLSRRLESMSEDGGSGRVEIYPQVINKFKSNNISSQILGNGFNSVIQDKVASLGRFLSAHNDYLEMLYDYGVIGVVIYLIFTIVLYRRLRVYKKYDIDLYRANVFGFIIFILMSNLSHLFIYPTYYCFLSALWGLSEGRIMLYKKNILIFNNLS